MKTYELIIGSYGDPVNEMTEEKRNKLLETGAIYWSDEMEVYFMTEKMFTPAEVKLLLTVGD